MDKDISIGQKRGCDKDSLNLILVKADVDSISEVFREYFGLEVSSCSNIKQYIELNTKAYQELEKLNYTIRESCVEKRKKIAIKKRRKVIYYPIPIWQYHHNNWSTISLSGKNNDDLSFAFSILLDTDVITFWESKYAVFREFKLFRKDKLVEHYHFGLECGNLYENYWDVIAECEYDSKLYPGVKAEEHKFCSSIRKVTELEIEQAVNNKRSYLHDRGYLDSCLKYHNAYISNLEETPLNCRFDTAESNLYIQQLSNSIEQMDIVMMSNNWSYYDRNVPEQVIKN